MINALSIDVEDWFCAYNLSEIVSREQWKTSESRVVSNTLKLLDLLGEKNIRATFFILGWIGEQFPDLVKEIDRRGHEIGTHGYSHALLTALTRDEFEKDLIRSLDVLRPHTGKEIIGFRAPSFTITESTYWALDILKKHGIKYDSSVFPVGFHSDYGISEVSLEPYEISQGLWEFPMSCFDLFKRRIPCCGGGYFRLFPYWFIRYGIKQCNRKGRPVVFYIHPWEIDNDQPRLHLSVTKRFRHYYNLEKTQKRLSRLLNDFEFAAICDVLETWKKNNEIENIRD